MSPGSGLRRFRVWTPEVPDLYLSKLSGFSNSVHNVEVPGMDPGGSGLKQLTVNKESKEDLKGIFHDVIFYPRVTSPFNLILSPQ
jgi:hypothetical protein